VKHSCTQQLGGGKNGPHRCVHRIIATAITIVMINSDNNRRVLITTHECSKNQLHRAIPKHAIFFFFFFFF
jgi:hypothetical protein